MILSKLPLLLLLSAISSFCLADALVCETYFLEAPDDWYSTAFEFGENGAVIDFHGTNFFDANLCTGNGIPMTCNIFIPDGTDSVLVSIDQTLNVSGGEHPSMEFSICLGTVNYGSEIIWNQVVNYQNPQTYKSGTFQFSPDWIEAGDYLGFYFRADVIPDE